MKRSTFLPLFLLSACATPPAPPPDAVMVAPGALLTLPAPAALGREIEAVQMVSAHHGGEDFTFEGHLSVTRERVLLAGTDGFGQRLMEIRWDGKAVIAQKAAFLPDALRPENILADVMMIYWPDAAIQAGLHGAPLGGRVAIERDRDPWNGHAHLANRAWDYEIDVRSSVVSP
jgi:hypothetical protein